MLDHDSLSQDECDFDRGYTPEPEVEAIFLSGLDLPEELIALLTFEYIYTSTDWLIAVEDRSVRIFTRDERVLIDRQIELAEKGHE